MSHYFRRRRTKRNSFLEKKLLKNLHINIDRQSFGTLTKFMMQKQFLDFSDRLAIRKSDFLKRKHLIFPTIFCSLSIKSKPIILNAMNLVYFYLLKIPF